MDESRTLTTKLPLTEAFESGYLIGNGIFPLDKTADRLRVAVAGEPAVEVLDDLEAWYRSPLELVPVDLEQLVDAVRHHFDAAESVSGLVRELDATITVVSESEDVLEADARDLANQAPVIRFVNLLIREAYQARASDIHFEAIRGGVAVRYRIDGVLSDAPSPPASLRDAVVSRIKLLAELDIAERRRPQDGRIRVRLEDRDIDLRVSTLPALFGESVVLRLLDRSGRPVGLEELGMSPETLGRFRDLVQRPHGIVLVTGPTGSGKTTTLYAALALRDAGFEKILTVEDPVEYQLEGVTQIPINIAAGVDFADVVRSMLRHDPDVLMVGEMRDAATAHAAVQSAMTGHLVFSTLHTNDTVSALGRLVDLEVEPYMVAATVEGILAQRLVRKICPHCRERYRPEPARVTRLTPVFPESLELERGAGCSDCRHTGYLGRTGVFELLVVEDELRREIPNSLDPSTLKAIADESGMQRLEQDGWAKVRAGITTIEEVARVTKD